MTFREVMNSFSVSRWELYEYMKKGMLGPEFKEEGPRREFRENEIAVLKKILVLKKLGCTVDEIAAMQTGELSFSECAKESIPRVEKEIADRERFTPKLANNTANLIGCEIAVMRKGLEITKSLLEEETSYDALDVERFWHELEKAEQGEEEAESWREGFLNVQKKLNNTFFDFRGMWKELGILRACGILLAICLCITVLGVVVQQKSLGEALWGLVQPFMIGLAVLLLSFLLYLLGRKLPRIASAVTWTLLILSVLFLAFLVLLILYGLIRYGIPRMFFS